MAFLLSKRLHCDINLTNLCRIIFIEAINKKAICLKNYVGHD